MATLEKALMLEICSGIVDDVIVCGQPTFGYTKIDGCHTTETLHHVARISCEDQETETIRSRIQDFLRNAPVGEYNRLYLEPASLLDKGVGCIIVFRYAFVLRRDTKRSSGLAVGDTATLPGIKKGRTEVGFAVVLVSLKEGKAVRRSSWPLGEYAYLVHASKFTTARPPLDTLLPAGTEFTYSPHIDIVDSSCRCRTANFTTEDLFATDWLVFDRVLT